MLQVEHISARYDLLREYVQAVDDVSFTVSNGEIFGIAGESGCGKSTLLKVLYDLVAYPLERTGGKYAFCRNRQQLVRGMQRRHPAHLVERHFLCAAGSHACL